MQFKIDHSRLHIQFIKFWLIGIVNTLIDLGGFNLLVAIFRIYSGPLVGVLSITSAGAAMINSYIFNRRFTFGINDAHRLEHIHKFVLASLGGIIINSLVVAVLSGLTRVFHISPHLVLSAGKLLGISMEGVWNFFTYRHWVFADA